MKIKITEPKFSGTYYSVDEIDKLKKWIFYQKPYTTPDPQKRGKENRGYTKPSIVSEPGRYYLVICTVLKNTFLTEAYTLSVVDAPTKEEFWNKFMKTFDLKQSRYKGVGGVWHQFDYIMARTKVPDGYKDIIEIAKK
jgi:hypothetical protein